MLAGQQTHLAAFLGLWARPRIAHEEAHHLATGTLFGLMGIAALVALAGIFAAKSQWA